MKTQALLQALMINTSSMPLSVVHAAMKRKSRAKERIYSFRDKFHQWDPKNQRPELMEFIQCPGS